MPMVSDRGHVVTQQRSNTANVTDVAAWHVFESDIVTVIQEIFMLDAVFSIYRVWHVFYTDYSKLASALCSRWMPMQISSSL